jgi:hypothetical protein
MIRRLIPSVDMIIKQYIIIVFRENDYARLDVDDKILDLLIERGD